MNTKKIINISGLRQEVAMAPVVVSASWHTDIPAFYSKWFFNRIRDGYLIWKNPRDGKSHFVCFDNTRFFVLWSKNPAPLIGHSDWLTSDSHGSYLHFTLNDYCREDLEPNLPPLQQRIDTFKRLSEIMGPDRVLWRYDPVMLTEDLDIDAHIERICRIGKELKGYTRKLIFSFVDIARYRRVARNLAGYGIMPVDWTDSLMNEFAAKLRDVNDADLGLRLATCAEILNLEDYGIEHNRCVDGELMKFLRPDDTELADFIDGVKRASWQRPGCGCIPAKDIGRYNSCPHGCRYCYATESISSAMANYRRHDPDALMLIPRPDIRLSLPDCRPEPEPEEISLIDPSVLEYRHSDPLDSESELYPESLL